MKENQAPRLADAGQPKDVRPWDHIVDSHNEAQAAIAEAAQGDAQWDRDPWGNLVAQHNATKSAEGTESSTSVAGHEADKNEAEVAASSEGATPGFFPEDSKAVQWRANLVRAQLHGATGEKAGQIVNDGAQAAYRAVGGEGPVPASVMSEFRKLVGAEKLAADLAGDEILSKPTSEAERPMHAKAKGMAGEVDADTVLANRDYYAQRDDTYVTRGGMPVSTRDFLKAQAVLARQDAERRAKWEADDRARAAKPASDGASDGRAQGVPETRIAIRNGNPESTSDAGIAEYERYWQIAGPKAWKERQTKQPDTAPATTALVPTRRIRTVGGPLVERSPQALSEVGANALSQLDDARKAYAQAVAGRRARAFHLGRRFRRGNVDNLATAYAEAREQAWTPYFRALREGGASETRMYETAWTAVLNEGAVLSADINKAERKANGRGLLGAARRFFRRFYTLNSRSGIDARSRDLNQNVRESVEAANEAASRQLSAPGENVPIEGVIADPQLLTQAVRAQTERRVRWNRRRAGALIGAGAVLGAAAAVVGHNLADHGHAVPSHTGGEPVNPAPAPTPVEVAPPAPTHHFEVRPGDFPWDSVARDPSIGQAGAEDYLHVLGDKAVANGHTVVWHQLANGREWVSVDGSSVTEDVVRTLEQFS